MSKASVHIDYVLQYIIIMHHDLFVYSGALMGGSDCN